jgi:hypothetical protein
MMYILGCVRYSDVVVVGIPVLERDVKTWKRATRGEGCEKENRTLQRLRRKSILGRTISGEWKFHLPTRV